MIGVVCAGDHRGRLRHEREPMAHISETAEWVCPSCRYARGAELVRYAIPGEYRDLPLGLLELANAAIVVVVCSRRGLAVEYPQVRS